jgi:hypothetical protein
MLANAACLLLLLSPVFLSSRARYRMIRRGRHLILSRVWRLYETGFGLSTGFIGSQVSYTQPSLLQLQLTLTTPAEFLQVPRPPAYPTGSH